MACPICKSDQFYVKNPDDDFDIYEFQYEAGKVTFADSELDAEVGDITQKREVYCQRCAWHGKKDAL